MVDVAVRSRPTTDVWKVGAVTVGAGFLLGVLDFLWIKYVPFPFGALGNSSAVWAVAAFLFAYRLRRGTVTGVLGAIGLLAVAVPSYYLAAAVVQGDDLANVWSPFWTAAALIAGGVFGAAGTFARRPDRWQIPALAVPIAVLFAETGLLLARLGDPNHDTPDVLGQALLEAGLGVALTLVVRTTWRRRSIALALALPFAVAGFGVFRGAGFA